ncbi:MAG: DNA gyrase inhibitor YacG [Gammaproteobacteria bacterium]|nr:DNA gyrase inhibitor YacG [Gammaproteobacteria bacterium]
MTTIVQCPHCGQDVAWNNQSKWRPFCSQRCKLIDLGAWADESYKIPTNETPNLDQHAPPQSNDT